VDICFDVTDTRIETPRLVLRAFAAGDLADFFAYASVPDVGEMAGWPHHDSIEFSQKVWEFFLETKDNFALWHKADRKVIGSLGLHESWANSEEAYRRLKVKEIGYVLAKEYWGQGLMPEAVGAVIDYGFGMLGLEAFTCGHFMDNTQSRRVIEKCGFCYVRHDFFDATQLGKKVEEVRYIRLRDRADAPESQADLTQKAEE